MSEAKFTQTKAKASASLLANNLVYNGTFYAYVSRNEIHLVDHKANLFEVEKAERVIKCAYADKDAVSAIHQCNLGANGSLLVIVSSSGGIAVFDELGEKCVSSHKLQKSQVAMSAKDANLRGIADDGQSNLFFASGSGEIIQFGLVGGKLSMLKKAPTSFARALWCVAYDKTTGTLAAGDEAGNLSVFNVAAGSDEITKAWEVKGAGSPVTSVKIGHGHIVTSDVNGKIRMYSIEKKALAVEVCAHARIINAITIHPTQPMVAAVSEDTHLSVWTLPTVAQPAIRSLLMSSPAPALLTGVTFSGKNAETIVCTIYDSKSLFAHPTPAL